MISRFNLIALGTLMAVVGLGSAPALAQSGDAIPFSTIMSWSRFPFLGEGYFGQSFGPEEPFDPSTEAALEYDILVIHLKVVDPDWTPQDPNNPQTSTGQDVYLGVEAFPLQAGFYSAPPAAPIPQATTDLPIKITPAPGQTSVNYDFQIQIPRIDAPNQARLRGLVQFDVAWNIVIRTSNDQSGSDPTKVSTVTQLLGALVNPILEPAIPQASANAGSDVTVAKGSIVTLDASRTFDSFNVGFNLESQNVILKNNLVFTWQWISGPEHVDPNQPDEHSPTATVTLNTDGTYVYRVTVDNNSSNDNPTQDSVTITVVDSLPVNNPPTAVIVGPANPVPIGAIVKLDGSKSFDPENNSLTFRWKQINEVGGDIAPSDLAKIFQPLSGVEQAVTTWQAISAGTFYFRLNVSDSEFLSTTTFKVTVFDPNNPSPTESSASNTGLTGVSDSEASGTPTTDSTDGKLSANGLLNGGALCGTGTAFALAPLMLMFGLRRRK